ncbi:phosphoglucomutase [Moesziomyces antarcticus T-34]|uniref:Phosphoglucomutase n=1 Tax=Pseudozyma antarctica (strain T-34) TaxID=1151754 RepID=M9MIP8_PSEA3|nr:phosphoglucomutase [Moesziomyces antarcticus T-34]
MLRLAFSTGFGIASPLLLPLPDADQGWFGLGPSTLSTRLLGVVPARAGNAGSAGDAGDAGDAGIFSALPLSRCRVVAQAAGTFCGSLQRSAAQSDEGLLTILSIAAQFQIDA